MVVFGFCFVCSIGWWFGLRVCCVVCGLVLIVFGVLWLRVLVVRFMFSILCL